MTIANFKDIVRTFNIPPGVIERMKKYYPDFPKMSEKEYKDYLWQTEISPKEVMAIQAMRTAMAIDMVEGKIKMQDWLNLKDDHKWVESYRKDNFKDYESAENHLKAVDEFYMRKYKHHYDLWWIDSKNEIPLLEWDSEMADRIIKKYGVKANKAKSSILDDFK
jgi:hypothetical protein